MGIQLPNHGLWGDKLKCRVVDMGSRLADHFEEHRHKAEEVYGSPENGVNVDGDPNLTLSQYWETK